MKIAATKFRHSASLAERQIKVWRTKAGYEVHTWLAAGENWAIDHPEWIDRADNIETARQQWKRRADSMVEAGFKRVAVGG